MYICSIYVYATLIYVAKARNIKVEVLFFQLLTVAAVVVYKFFFYNPEAITAVCI